LLEETSILRKEKEWEVETFQAMRDLKKGHSYQHRTCKDKALKISFHLSLKEKVLISMQLVNCK
jgi:hypothetical protein